MLCKRMLVAAAHTAFCDCCEASVQHIRDLTLMYGARQLLGMPFVACKNEMLLSQSNLQTSTVQHKLGCCSPAYAGHANAESAEAC